MKPPIRDRKKLLALPWPDEVPTLRAKDFCPYAETRSGARSLYEWISAVFGYAVDPTGELRAQFTWLMYDVINESADSRERGEVMVTDVPSPSSANRRTRAPYSGEEVAAWWAEALQRAGYDVVPASPPSGGS